MATGPRTPSSAPTATPLRSWPGEETSQTYSPCGEPREMPARVWSMWTMMTSTSSSSRSRTTDTSRRTPWTTSPASRMFGRQMLFFKCADRTERRVCTEAQLLENLETFYGSESDEETAERIASIGLPENKYDAAAVSIAVLQNAMSEEEKFIERFLWDLNGDSSM